MLIDTKTVASRPYRTNCSYISFNYSKCNYCTKNDANSSTPIYQPSATGGSCIAASDCSGEYMVSGGLCKMKPTAASCANDGKVLQGKECVSSCGASFKLNAGECDRIRYTPAEAAAVLKDTDNKLIMTFKVNR